MKREEALNKYIKNDVKSILLEQLNLLESDFKNICKDILEKQKDNSKVGYIVFSLLRKNIIDYKYEYPVFIYNKQMYLEKGYEVRPVSLDFIYSYYEKFLNLILKEYRKYVLKIFSCDVKYISMRYLEYFHAYGVEIMRIGIIKAMENDEYDIIKKEDYFEIKSGEYYEPCDYIYKEITNKDYKKIKWLLSKREQKTFSFEDLRGININNMDLHKLDFRYVDFRKSNLANNNFINSYLIGSRFCNSNLENSTFMITDITDCNFENANLENTDFRYSLSYINNKTGGLWSKSSFIGTNFKNSILKNSTFDYAVIKGADFRGADLTGSSFKETVLYNSKFTFEQMKNLHFTKEQLNQIIT